MWKQISSYTFVRWLQTDCINSLRCTFVLRYLHRSSVDMLLLSRSLKVSCVCKCQVTGPNYFKIVAYFLLVVAVLCFHKTFISNRVMSGQGWRREGVERERGARGGGGKGWSREMINFAKMPCRIVPLLALVSTPNTVCVETVSKL